MKHTNRYTFGLNGRVATEIKKFVELESVQALVNMVDGNCGSFASSITGVIQLQADFWINPHTVERYIRVQKEVYRREMAFQFNNNLNKGQV